MSEGRRVGGREFVLYHAPRTDPGPARVGFTVPTRVGGAVVRNRARRLLREAVRGLTPRLVACDVVLAARPEIADARLADLDSGLNAAAERAGLIRSDS